MDELIERIKNEKDIFSKAKLIKHLLKEKSIKVVDLAGKLWMTSSYLCHLNRLNNLPEIVIDGYYSGLVNISHLFLISRVKEEKKLIQIYEKILSDNLTVKQTEDLIREIVYEIKNKGNYIKKKEKEDLIYRIKNRFPDANINITQTRTKSKVMIEIKGNLEKTSKMLRELGRSF